MIWCSVILSEVASGNLCIIVSYFSRVSLPICSSVHSVVLLSLSFILPLIQIQIHFICLNGFLAALSFSLEASFSGQRAVSLVCHAPLSVSALVPTGWCISCPWQPCAGDVFQLECWESRIRNGMSTCQAQSAAQLQEELHQRHHMEAHITISLVLDRCDTVRQNVGSAAKQTVNLRWLRCGKSETEMLIKYKQTPWWWRWTEWRLWRVVTDNWCKISFNSVLTLRSDWRELLFA